MKVPVDCKSCKEPHFDHFECSNCRSHLHGSYTCGGCANQEQNFCSFCGEPLKSGVTDGYQLGTIVERDAILRIIQNKIDISEEYGLNCEILKILKRDILKR